MITQVLLVGVSGLALGSFVNALVWRLHEQAKSKKQKARGNRQKELSILHGRSMCPNCRHTLAWYDLLPVVSWSSLRGKCRYCKKPISLQYPLVELGVAFSFALSLFAWPYELASALSWLIFAVWLVILAIFWALALYDLKHMLLPNKLVYPAGVAAVIFTLLLFLEQGEANILVSSVYGLLLGGFFWLIYQLSDGKWIGGGDVRLGFAMGVLLGWQKSLVALMLAAYIGLFIIIILALAGRYKPKMRIAFGPLLILGTFATQLYGQKLVDSYLAFVGL